MNKKIKLLIFDVNETLLDLTPIKVAINAAIKNPNAFEQWFALLLHYSLVETVTGKYEDFGKIGKATLKMVLKSQQVELDDSKIEQLLSLIKSLPPHPDVISSLEKLHEAGFTMVALTNGTLDVAKEQLKFAGIDKYMVSIFSVESSSAFKPHPSTYQYVLSEMKVEPSEAMMVASHAWDITGAQRAGLQGCFIAREGKVTYPLETSPVIKETNLIDAVKKILEI